MGKSDIGPILFVVGVGALIYFFYLKGPVKEAQKAFATGGISQPYLGGLKSTNALGFDITTAFKNLRDNLSFGGALF